MDASRQPLQSKPVVQRPSTSSFKGIALFTPGGDCVYCVDIQKRTRWHIDLCAKLQSQLSLVEPPYFLLPCFTATIDCWYDETSQRMMTVAEAYPRALPFQALLNVLFNQESYLQWVPNYTFHEECSPSLIESFHPQFPQLWESHDLLLRVDEPLVSHPVKILPENEPQGTAPTPRTFVFKLFVRGAETTATEQMLKLLHTTLETELQNPYTLQLIDVIKHPEQAETYHISATPSLIQVFPEPTRRIVGALTNPELLRQLLISAEIYP